MPIIHKKEANIFRHNAAALMAGLLLIIAICINAHAVTTHLPTDPGKALFETIDVENFIRTFQLLPEIKVWGQVIYLIYLPYHFPDGWAGILF